MACKYNSVCMYYCAAVQLCVCVVGVVLVCSLRACVLSVPCCQFHGVTAARSCMQLCCVGVCCVCTAGVQLAYAVYTVVRECLLCASYGAAVLCALCECSSLPLCTDVLLCCVCAIAMCSCAALLSHRCTPRCAALLSPPLYAVLCCVRYPVYTVMCML